MKSLSASAPLAKLMKVLSYQKGIGIEAMATASFRLAANPAAAPTSSASRPAASWSSPAGLDHLRVNPASLFQLV
jgi:hypothetical protein